MVVRINDEKINCPERWEQLTTDQYQKIVGWDTDKELTDRDYFKLFNILSKREYPSFVDTPENQFTLLGIVEWVLYQPFPYLELHETIEIRDRTIAVPREIKLLSIGQNIHARQEIDKAVVLRNRETGKLIDCSCYSILVAIYLQPLVDGGDFDFKKAQVLEREIASMPIVEVRAIGFFLLNHVLMRGQSSIPTWRKILTNLIRKEKRLLVNSH